MMLGLRTWLRLDGVIHKSSSGLNNSSGTVPSESVRRPERSQNTRSSSLSIHESTFRQK